MMELVDIGDLKSPDHNGRVGSIPTLGTLMMRTVVRTIRDVLFPKDEPLITISVHKEALLQNLRAYQREYPEAQFAPVLKSNAYGHGLCVVARILESEPIAFFMVDSLYEARRLRAGGIRKRILVMGYVRPRTIATNTLSHIDFAITSLSQLKELSALATGKTRVHLKIDSGMHRQGILPEELDEAIRLVRENSSIVVSGIGSHFADADTEHSALTKRQIERFTQAQEKLTQAFGEVPFRHISATKGVPFLEETNTTVVRLGIGLYGFDTSATKRMSLQPALSMHTVVSSVRTIPAGESVGYNGTYTTDTEETLATIPTGYYEGVDRALSNKGGVYIKGVWCPFRGRVSMNMSTVDVTLVPDIRPLDPVLVISNNLHEQNAVTQMAEDAGTTPYVILAHLPEHLKRVVV
jgi:alanine racemase